MSQLSRTESVGGWGKEDRVRGNSQPIKEILVFMFCMKSWYRKPDILGMDAIYDLPPLINGIAQLSHFLM